MVSRLASVPHKQPKTIGHHRSKWLQLYFRLLLSESLSSRSQWYLFWNLDIPTSQSALKQSYKEDTNGQNNDDKIKKPILGSHSISVNYFNLLVYFRITHNKFKAALTVLSWHTDAPSGWGYSGLTEQGGGLIQLCSSVTLVCYVQYSKHSWQKKVKRYVQHTGSAWGYVWSNKIIGRNEC